MNHKAEHNFDAEIKKELKELKHNINDLKDTYIKQATHLAAQVPAAIHRGEEKLTHKVEENPLASVGFAAAIGFVIGALFTGKK